MKKGIITATVLGFISFGVFAQNNLVENPSFEQTEKKVKKGVGEIYLATGWYSPDEEKPADLFAETVKKEYSQPENVKGYQLPATGQNYAGIRVWVDRGSDPIHYIQTKLKDKLIAGKSYCVSFKVSLADLSKFGNANIGANISAKKPRSRDLDSYEVKANIHHSKKRVFKDQYLWETICSVYKAEGDERYLTIGGFANPEMINEKKETVRLRMSSQFRGQRQTSDTYFFIDDVSVVNMEEIDACNCEEGESGDEMEVVYSESVGETDEDTDISTKIELRTIYFDENSAEYSNKDVLVDMLQTLIANQEINITVVGHSDKGEELNSTGNISQERAKAVKAYLVENGIEESRVSIKAMKDMDRVDESGTQKGKAKNRRVTFEVNE
jgi:outer membrane protein OmpA-like peptidoglycan-associated protein